MNLNHLAESYPVTFTEAVECCDDLKALRRHEIELRPDDKDLPWEHVTLCERWISPIHDDIYVVHAVAEHVGLTFWWNTVVNPKSRHIQCIARLIPSSCVANLATCFERAVDQHHKDAASYRVKADMETKMSVYASKLVCDLQHLAEKGVQ